MRWTAGQGLWAAGPSGGRAQAGGGGQLLKPQGGGGRRHQLQGTGDCTAEIGRALTHQPFLRCWVGADGAVSPPTNTSQPLSEGVASDVCVPEVPEGSGSITASFLMGLRAGAAASSSPVPGGKGPGSQRDPGPDARSSAPRWPACCSHDGGQWPLQSEWPPAGPEWRSPLAAVPGAVCPHSVGSPSGRRTACSPALASSSFGASAAALGPRGPGFGPAEAPAQRWSRPGRAAVVFALLQVTR